MDTLDLERRNSGRDIYPCTVKQSEVNCDALYYCFSFYLSQNTDNIFACFIIYICVFIRVFACFLAF